MTHTKGEALKLTLNRAVPSILSPGWMMIPDKDFAVIKQALAQTVQEPTGVCGNPRNACGLPCEPCEGKPDPEWITRPASPVISAGPITPAMMRPWTEDERKELEATLNKHLVPTPPAQPAVPLTPAKVNAMAEAHGIDGDARHWFVVGITDCESSHGIK
jgi:hypothetical protein